MATEAMDAIVRSRVVQDFIYFPVIVLLAIRTDNLKHSPFSCYPKLKQRSTFSQGNLRKKGVELWDFSVWRRGLLNVAA